MSFLKPSFTAKNNHSRPVKRLGQSGVERISTADGCPGMPFTPPFFKVLRYCLAINETAVIVLFKQTEKLCEACVIHTLEEC